MNEKIQPKDKETDIFNDLEKRKEEAPKIKKLEALSIDEIAKKNGVEIEDLEDKIRERAKQVADELKDACSCNEKYLEFVDTLYNLFLLSKEKSVSKKYPWLSNFESFEKFVKNYCPEAKPNSQAYIGDHIDWFLNSEFYISPKVNQTRTVSMPPRDVYYMREEEKKNEIEMYLAEGDWVLMPEKKKYWNDLYMFVEKEVIIEIVNLVENGYEKPDLTHSSGSAALKGFSKHGSVLCAAEAQKRGEKIMTGEFTSFVMRRDMESLSERNGARNIYADKSGMPHFLRGYNTANWFDEYYVTLGIDKEKQEKYLKTRDEEIKDFGSEGMLIGSEVPLENINTVYYQKIYEQEVKKWVEENCPHVRIVSLEADGIFHDYHNLINQIAQREDKEPVEIWKSLAK